MMQAAFAIRDGKRLEIPQGTPPNLAQVNLSTLAVLQTFIQAILSCWNLSPNKRPTMDELSLTLSAIEKQLPEN